MTEKYTPNEENLKRDKKKRILSTIIGYIDSLDDMSQTPESQRTETVNKIIGETKETIDGLVEKMVALGLDSKENVIKNIREHQKLRKQYNDIDLYGNYIGDESVDALIAGGLE